MPPIDVTTLRATLLDALTRAIDGDSWHGPALRILLQGVTAEQAHATVLPGVHSIWAIVLHLTAWADEVARRGQGHAPAEPRMGDWPAVPPTPDDDAWRRARVALDTANDDARRALDRIEPARLMALVGDGRDPALGSGVTHAAMFAGLAQHHAYHGGQIALLRKVLAAR